MADAALACPRRYRAAAASTTRTWTLSSSRSRARSAISSKDRVFARRAYGAAHFIEAGDLRRVESVPGRLRPQTCGQQPRLPLDPAGTVDAGIDHLARDVVHRKRRGKLRRSFVDRQPARPVLALRRGFWRKMQIPHDAGE